jgi:hypothetical protein
LALYTSSRIVCRLGCRLHEGLILVHVHLFTLDRFEKTFRDCVLGWLSRSGYADAGTDIEEALHIHIAIVLSSATWLVDQPGKGLAASPKPTPELAAAVVHRCVERGSSRCMCYGAKCLLGSCHFTIHVTLFLNILDLYSFIMIYCYYGKE